jgi:hypothetical protein
MAAWSTATRINWFMAVAAPRVVVAWAVRAHVRDDRGAVCEKPLGVLTGLEKDRTTP